MNIVEACCLLHVAPTAAQEEIKAIFRGEASRWHPDRGGDGEAMQMLNAARDYLLSMPASARGREWRRLKPQIGAIMEMTIAKMDTWEARQAAAAAASPEPASEPVPPVTNKRRAADWEARHSDKVREQTKARVAAHRARDPEQYRAYMREYMKQRRAKS